MNTYLLRTICLLAVVSIAAFALIGCAGKTESGAPQPTGASTAQAPMEEVVYTVSAGELENPDNKPVYACPMEEHKDQVSLDPNARCSICKMKLVPLEEAEKAGGGEADENHSEHEHGM
ncbi:MAG: hypothetical protein GTN69_08720 [Armatimonadetes bacterium]|nr:hypothetical protein [Armatimonadota bacterium]NIO75947.1 hypothetical protein [Armatimonadota bacterium]NIO98759.1 hypothetical protein [Armatimonadota bacterium]